jgi:MYXO-CTERM domain-containing protein
MGLVRSVTGLALVFALLAPSRLWATTYYVAQGGNDAAPGSMSAPWATLQRAADAVGSGDQVVVQPGSYAGFYLEASGGPGAEITFSAQEGVIVTEENSETPDGINLEGASHVVVEGFTVSGMQRAGLRAVLGAHVTFRNNQAHDNGRWGILTGFVDDLLIEGNRTSGSVIEHGIYVSNSGDRPVIRRNIVWNNSRNGIHMNGDAEQGGDGIISDAIVEANTIYSNGSDGGSGINCDGVQDSLIVNNLIYDSRASGISLYRIDGGGPSSGNSVINNTVVVASTGRWALNIQNDSAGNEVFNNIFFNLHASRGAISLCGPGCAAGFVSDYNVTLDRFTADDSSVLSIAAWRTATGQDVHTTVCDASAVFVDLAMNDYRVSEASAARDVGTSLNAPLVDHDGNARPEGAAVDVGAFEYCGDACQPAVGGSSVNGGSAGAGGVLTAGGSPNAGGGPGPGAGNGSGGSRAGSSGNGAGASGSSGGASASAGAATQAGQSGNEAGVGNADDAGCSCKLAGPRPRSAWIWLGALALLALRRKRSSLA